MRHYYAMKAVTCSRVVGEKSAVLPVKFNELYSIFQRWGPLLGSKCKLEILKSTNRTFSYCVVLIFSSSPERVQTEETSKITLRISRPQRNIWLVWCRYTDRPEEEDKRTFVKIMALKAFDSQKPLFVQVHTAQMRQELQPYLDPRRDSVIALQETRSRLLAVSCFVPGASTFIGS